MSNRDCMRCRHCYFSPGSPGFSELTPGDPMSWYCTKGHWDVDSASSKRDIRAWVAKAETCPDYSEEQP